MTEEKKPLQGAIDYLYHYRQQLQEQDSLYKEAEMCYQMISLYGGLQEVLEGKTYAKPYMEEKAETVFLCFRCLLEGKIRL